MHAHTRRRAGGGTGCTPWSPPRAASTRPRTCTHVRVRACAECARVHSAHACVRVHSAHACVRESTVCVCACEAQCARARLLPVCVGARACSQFARAPVCMVCSVCKRVCMHGVHAIVCARVGSHLSHSAVPSLLENRPGSHLSAHARLHVRAHVCVCVSVCVCVCVCVCIHVCACSCSCLCGCESICLHTYTAVSPGTLRHRATPWSTRGGGRYAREALRAVHVALEPSGRALRAGGEVVPTNDNRRK
jgi:hypothetical protein